MLVTMSYTSLQCPCSACSSKEAVTAGITKLIIQATLSLKVGKEIRACIFVNLSV